MLLFGDPADARPAVLVHWGEVFEAFEIHGNISSFLTGSLLADGESFVDIIDAADLEVMRAWVGETQGEESKEQDEDLDHW